MKHLDRGERGKKLTSYLWWILEVKYMLHRSGVPSMNDLKEKVQSGVTYLLDVEELVGIVLTLSLDVHYVLPLSKGLCRIRMGTRGR